MRNFQSLKRFSSFVLENENMNLQEALKKIESLEDKIDELNDELADANQELEDAKSELDTMGWDKQALVDEVEELKGIKREFEELNDNYDELKDEKKTLKEEYDELESEKLSLEERIEILDTLEDWESKVSGKDMDGTRTVYDFLAALLNSLEDYPLEMAKVYQEDPKRIFDRVLNAEILGALKSKGASLLNRYE